MQRIYWGSRDSARTPVQWSDAPNAGFTTGTPWFAVNENYPKINVAAQEDDPDSLLNFYREALRLRHELPVVRYGTFRQYYPLSNKLFVYERRAKRERLSRPSARYSGESREVQGTRRVRSAEGPAPFEKPHGLYRK